MTLKRTLLLLLYLITTLYGCAANFTMPEGATTDAKFVGKWEGKHFNEESGYWRKWLQTRNANGTYNLTLKYYDKSEKYLETKEVTGYWWIQNGMFHEIAKSNMSKPEVYKFQFIRDDTIEFSSAEVDSSSGEETGYSFKDTRVK